MKLSFHGADRGVTGSCHLVHCAGRRILIDCGLYQGNRALEEDNANPFGFDPSSIDLLLLTHGHLDHCGRIPLLVKRGFRGEIVTTSATHELARLVMLDAAYLQEADARRRQRRSSHARNRHKEAEELYSTVDALNAVDFFGRTVSYGEQLSLAPGIAATFFDAGHILGSSSILLNLTEGGRQRRVLFSGDIGNSNRPLLRDPVVPKGADVVVMETTYGDRRHRSIEASIRELQDAVADALLRGGNVVIPTFALERAQEILFYLREAVAAKRLPRNLQVFLDSPMAVSATEIFKRHQECYDAETAAIFRKGHDPFHLPGLHFVRKTEDSKALNVIKGGAVLMAGSGMCTGGRVRHHLQQNLSRSHSSVIFVGFAASGTLARSIIDGAKTVRLFGEEVPVRARIFTINGFSAHADQAELLDWHRRTGRPETTVLVHGEAKSMHSFARLLKHTRVVMPAEGEELTL